MADNSFLDKGVVLGYCFLTDTHHVKCADYIESENAEFFATKQVEDIFRKTKKRIIKNHRRAIFDFIAKINSHYSGSLSSSDIEEIQEMVDRYENDAWRYLLDHFEGREGEELYVVTKKLREIVRDMEQMAQERNEYLDSIVLGWVRYSTYPEMEDKLESLLEQDPEDFGIALDAHDVAKHLEGTTELATNNPSDFDDDNVRAEILENTDIDDIQLVFVSRDYSP